MTQLDTAKLWNSVIAAHLHEVAIAAEEKNQNYQPYARQLWDRIAREAAAEREAARLERQ